MPRLYGPIDREVQVAEIRHIRMLQRLETNRLIAQAREENGTHRGAASAYGSDLLRSLKTRVANWTLVRRRSAVGTDPGAAA